MNDVNTELNKIHTKAAKGCNLSAEQIAELLEPVDNACIAQLNKTDALHKMGLLTDQQAVMRYLQAEFEQVSKAEIFIGREASYAMYGATPEIVKADIEEVYGFLIPDTYPLYNLA